MNDGLSPLCSDRRSSRSSGDDDRLAVDIENQVADVDAGGVRRAGGADADDQQRPVTPVCALRLWELDRLHRDTDEAAPRRAGDEQLVPRMPTRSTRG